MYIESEKFRIQSEGNIITQWKLRSAILQHPWFIQNKLRLTKDNRVTLENGDPYYHSYSITEDDICNLLQDCFKNKPNEYFEVVCSDDCFIIRQYLVISGYGNANKQSTEELISYLICNSPVDMEQIIKNCTLRRSKYIQK